MNKREREHPCGVCGHFHNHEQGEVCGICGHRETDRTGGFHFSAFPSEILPEFLYLGTYDNASQPNLLKAQGISHILDTLPADNIYKHSFTYHCLQKEKVLPFDDAIQFLDKCEKEKGRVLVHCMSGKSRSPAIVIAYLMKCKGWRLAQSYQWVKERRSSVDLSPAFSQQLQDYEQKIFGSVESNPGQVNLVPNPVPGFGNLTINSIFNNAVPLHEFTFGGGRNNEIPNHFLSPTPANGNDTVMES